MIPNKIVARYQDGRVLKGFTADFLPTKPLFHLTPIDAPPGAKGLAVQFADLKAIFFVRDLAGNPQRSDVQEFRPDKPAIGRKIRVDFRDGETIVGTTQGYDPSRPGFFIIPADQGSNNERCFVITSATQRVTFL